MLYRRLWRISRVVPRERLEGNSLARLDKLHYGGKGTELRMDGLLLIHSSAHHDDMESHMDGLLPSTRPLTVMFFLCTPSSLLSGASRG